MKKHSIDVEEISFSSPYEKFKTIYREARYVCGEVLITFPVFDEYSCLNEFLYKLIDFYNGSDALKITFVYADKNYVSLKINELLYFNYSIQNQSLITPSMLLNEYCGGKRYVKKCCKRNGKYYKPLYHTLRSSFGGFKINIKSSKTDEILTLKISKQNKIHQKT